MLNAFPYKSLKVQARVIYVHVYLLTVFLPYLLVSQKPMLPKHP